MKTVKDKISEDFTHAAENVKLEYIELVDADSLQAKEKINSKERQHNKKNSITTEHVLCIAGYVGSVRLIDNLFL
jgi:pantothenate synthetase